MKNLGFQGLLDLLCISKPLATTVSRKRVPLTVQEFESIAEVVERICPHQRGRVRYRGSYWYARTEQDVCILPMTKVLVIGRENLTLLVKPLSVIKRRSVPEHVDSQIRHLQPVG